MIKIISFVACSIVCLSCSSDHKTPEEIYQSGEIENFNDFVRTDPVINLDNDTLVEKYVYRYDTSFKVEKMYTYTYSTQKKTFRNLAFYYKGKKEGKVIFYNTDGSIMGTAIFKNDERISLESPK